MDEWVLRLIFSAFRGFIDRSHADDQYIYETIYSLFFLFGFMAIDMSVNAET